MLNIAGGNGNQYNTSGSESVAFDANGTFNATVNGSPISSGSYSYMQATGSYGSFPGIAEVVANDPAAPLAYNYAVFTSSNGGTFYRTDTNSSNSPFDYDYGTFTINTTPTPPAFTSPNQATFTPGVFNTFTVTTTGSPTPTLHESNYAGTASGLPAGVTFQDNGDGTATLSGTPAAGTGGNSYPVVLGASNGDNAVQGFTLAVAAPPPPITFLPIPANPFVVGVFNSITITVTGSPTPQIFESNLAGTGSGLPAGLTFHNNGDGTATIAGTPAAGTGGNSYPLILGASNGNGSNVVQGFNLPVFVLQPSPPQFTSPNQASFTPGVFNSFAITTTGSPTAQIFESNYAGNASGLPSGVSFHNNGDGTGTLSGTPAAGTAGAYPVFLGASNGSNAGQGFTLTVSHPAPPAFRNVNHASFAVGLSGSFTITVSGSPVPNLFESDVTGATSGLPGGVSFQDNGNGTATLSGTPASGTNGTYFVILGATNGSAVVQGFNLTVGAPAPPAFTNVNQANFAIGLPGSFTIATVGAPTPNLFESDQAGDNPGLPPGLTYHANGDGTATISGTPAAGTLGTYNLVLGAANAVTAGTVAPLTLNVVQPVAPSFPPIGNQPIFPGVPFSFTITVPGVPTPQIFESNLAGSASGLPPGVTFHDNGDGTATIFGTPAAGSDGTYPLVIGAANGQSDVVAPLTLIVGTPVLPVITSADQTTFTVGSSGSFMVTTGGSPVPSLFESDEAGDASGLPAGVTFQDNGDGTATLSGTPAAGSAGSYFVILGAFNGTGVVQGFTLTVM